MPDEPENKDSEEEDTGDEGEDSTDENEDSKEDEDKDEGDNADDDKDSEDSSEDPINPDDVEVDTRGEVKPKKPDAPAKPSESDEDIDAEDQKTITTIVQRETAEIKKSNRALEDKVDVDSFIRDNPQFSRYRGTMLKHMGHESYKNVSVKNIAAIVSAEDMQKLGAKKEREASEKAKETEDKGGSARKTIGGKVDWHNASTEAFNKKLGEIKGYPIEG